jgi:hypothetical protein
MRVIIVISIYKETISELEKISLTQCLKLFKNKEIAFLCPYSIKLDNYLQLTDRKINAFHFEDEYFKNITSYNKLLLSSFFYERFSEYQYMLIYQLDAFVFKDDLDYWCAKKYDYIGAPWFENFSRKNDTNRLWAVGNGGLSLRNIHSFINVFHSNKKPLSPIDIWNLYSNHSLMSKIVRIPKMLYLFFSSKNNINNVYEIFGENEDRFWSFFAQKINKDFKVAPIHEALQFAFECNPRKMYELNHFQLPFGVHAWEKHDKEFWRPFMLESGYSV